MYQNIYCGRVPTIYVLSKNMKIVEKIKLKIVIFTAVKNSLYIAWACFRNGNHQICPNANMVLNIYRSN